MVFLALENLSKSYGDTVALDRVSLDIKVGEKVALLGSNGAGKSTLVNICAGLRKQDDGSALVFNAAPSETIAKKRFSILPQSLSFPKGLKCREIINLVASHYKSPNTSELISRLEISKLLDKTASDLSGGEQRRIAFLLTFLGQPELCFLDEPTANIDIENKDIIYRFLDHYYRSKTRSLLFTSHQMDEVERVAERLIVLHHGKVILDRPVNEVKTMFSLSSLRFKSTKKLPRLSSCEKLVNEGDFFTLYCQDTDQTIKELCAFDIPFENLTIKESQLEEIVLNMWRNHRDSA